MDHIHAKKVELPSFARVPDVELDDDGGKESFEAFQPFLDKIYKHLDKELERSFNDPEIFFLNEDDGLPLRKDVTGEYYVSDITYELGEFHDGGTFVMWVMLHCLCNEAEARGEDRDYVSMEMIVYLPKTTLELEYEPEFQSAAI
jgi:hypothetical protein